MFQRREDVEPAGDILIIDDARANLKLLSGILTVAGYRTHTAASGQLGLEAAAATPPDLILLDICMPGMDGLEVCQHLKARENSREIPVIFVSALGDGFNKAEGFRLGAVDYITKPFESAEVLARVNTHLTIRHTQSKLIAANRQLLSAMGEVERLNLVLEARIQQRTEELDSANACLQHSEARFREFVEDTHDLVTQVDGQGRFLYANHAVRKVLGIPPESCIGLSSDAFIDRRDRERTERWLARCVRLRLANASIENRIVSLGGETRDMTWMMNFHYDDQGHLAYINSIGRDISDRKKVEKDLQKSEARLKEAQRLAKIGSWEFDIVRNALNCSDEIYSIYEVDAPEFCLTHEAFLNTVHPEDRDSVHAAYRSSVKDRTPFAIDHRLLLKDGCIKYVHQQGKTYYDGQGYPVRTLGTMQDITVRTQAEQAMRDAAAERRQVEIQLQRSQKMEAIGTLAGGIAHDFNNILSSILGYAELGKFELSGNELNLGNYLDQVIKAGLRAKDLVQHILTFSRKSDLDKGSIQISLLIKEAVKFLRASLPAAIEIQTDFDDENAKVVGNATQIHQIIMNLCTNAAHAMKAAGGVIKIRLERVALKKNDLPIIDNMDSGDYVRLTVSDTGKGMPGEIIERIFDPFFTTKERGEGTGMGLSCVHGIVTEMKGTIHVESEPGSGTVFQVLLPLDAAHSGEDAQPGDWRLLKGTGRILLVDDEESIVMALSKILQKLGYDVTGMTSSPGALDLFAADPESFDLVITDIGMPAMNGIDLSKRLSERRPGVPIILCTGFSADVTERTIREIGIRGLLMKPVILSELAEIVKKNINQGNG